MRSLILLLRGLVFGFFVICNAIICSVAVWHLGLAQTVSYNPPVDIYLIFLGAFSLLFIFAIIWIDIIRKDAVTSRVWFECLWVGIFWALELTGTAVLTASGSTFMCSLNVKLVVPQACNATQVLQAFTWLCMILTLVYVVALTSLAVVHQKQNTDVWRTGVRAFNWFGAHEHLESRTCSPVRATVPSFAAPRPRHAAPPPIFSQYSRSSVQALEKDSSIMNVSMIAPHPYSGAPRPSMPAQAPREHVRHNSAGVGAVSLYPQQVQRNLSPATSTQAIENVAPSSPPPLGEWPRADILSRPHDTHTRRKQSHPPVAAPSPQRPRGSRSRSSSGEMHRPPPLDLSSISFFRNIDDRSQNRP